MKKLEEVKNQMGIVRDIFEMLPELKDDDKRLIKEVWKVQGLTGDIKVSVFINMLINGRYYWPDNITRARRKLQELYPEMRGKTWNKRHDLAEEFSDGMLKLF